MELREKQQAILLTKIERRRDEIRQYMVSDLRPVTSISFKHVEDFTKPSLPIDIQGFKPIAVGEQWGNALSCWFRIVVDVPAEWASKEVALCINIGGEGCVYIDGSPYQGVDGNHQEVLLSQCARGGEHYELLVDCISQHWIHWTGKGNPVLSRCEIGTRNRGVKDYWFSLNVLLLVAKNLPVTSARRGKIIYTLNKSVDAFDYTNTDADSLRASAQAANDILRPLLDCKASDSAGNVAVHGHSHIDVAWLWPYAETMRKCARTFSTVMRLMEQYPEYIFTQSQPQLYEYTKQLYPELYAQIKERVKEGRWDATGSMWVEADCNLCSGESLVRQVTMGKRFFMDEFGIEADVLWLPDVFGYAASLPQILKRARIPYFSTIKISWNQFNRLPYNTFHWKGIDGSSVLSHLPPTGDYNAYPEPMKIQYQVENYSESDRCDWSLLSYGHGDGGGGPEDRHLELIRRSQDLEGLPRCRQMKVSEFFELIKDTPDLPEWAGELYLEYHRGTYTTQAINKLYNRKAEFLYRDAELLSSIAAPMGVDYPYDDLHEQWKRILCNQFHDVIPGSSVRAVYDDTDEMYPEILAVGERTADEALSAVVERMDTTGEGEAIVLFNSLSWGRTDIARVKLPDDGDYTITSNDGAELPSQINDGEISFTALVPSMGYSTYRLVNRAGAGAASVSASQNRIENQFFVVTLNSDGSISSILEKSTGRETISEGQAANLLKLYEDKPNDYDAWDIDFFYEDKFEDITALDNIELIGSGEVWAGVEITRSFGSSRLKQKIVLYSDIPRIDFDTWVDWRESHKCLKACFPVDVNTNKARYEIQFGNVERPTHSNTSWDVAQFEVCAHKWADISEEGFGVCLMNDCKYGYHTVGSEMRLTLLRSPKEPDPNADLGEHFFTYSLMPHAGDYVEAETVKQAYALNVPLRSTLVASSSGELPAEYSFISVDSPNAVLETVKKAEREQATILRFYECHNQRGSVDVSVGLPFERVYECDLMEDNICELENHHGTFSFEIRPFEIRTFKLI